VGTKLDQDFYRSLQPPRVLGVTHAHTLHQIFGPLCWRHVGEFVSQWPHPSHIHGRRGKGGCYSSGKRSGLLHRKHQLQQDAFWHLHNKRSQGKGHQGQDQGRDNPAPSCFQVGRHKANVPHMAHQGGVQHQLPMPVQPRGVFSQRVCPHDCMVPRSWLQFGLMRRWEQRCPR
jgi:hypothetical protein